ncbi:hypothetical protein N9L76_03875 [bacterium]|jgi:hypothetical protein|nr:hypothetical protein [bacterium]|tara:strand:+ start:21327 stop:22007 length:681 start_codon:yes stop_codon:yes gene_type:complete
MTATHARISYAAAALCLVAVLAAATPAHAREVADGTTVKAEKETTVTPDAAESDTAVSGKWFWGGWYGWRGWGSWGYNYYPYYCNYWNYGYGHGGYGTYGAKSAKAKNVTAVDAVLRAAEVRADTDSVTAARGTAKRAKRSNEEDQAEDPTAFRRVRASVARTYVAKSCAEWLGVTKEQLNSAPSDVAVVDDKCCWPSGCALAASTGCDYDGAPCCVPDSERNEGC